MNNLSVYSIENSIKGDRNGCKEAVLKEEMITVFMRPVRAEKERAAGWERL